MEHVLEVKEANVAPPQLPTHMMVQRVEHASIRVWQGRPELVRNLRQVELRIN
eukprot:COSAG02_NODE_2858_length_7884_cov_15.028388_5_plen_53_part_00